MRARNCGKDSAAGGMQALEMGTSHSFRGIGVDYPSSENEMIDIEEAKRILAAEEK
jgi:hypothetical protein